MHAEKDLVKEEREKLVGIVRSEHGRSPEAIESIAPGLGTRRFYRIRFATGEPATLIARVEAKREKADPPQESINSASLNPPSWLPEPALEPLRAFLEAAGLPVPHSFAHLPEQGVDLLEDVGARTLADASESARGGLYREACGFVPRLQRLSAPPDRIPAFGRSFDRALVRTKAWKWLHWTIPGLLDRPPSAEEESAVESAFSQIATLLEQAPRRLAHRDFKAENLHLVTEQTGEKDERERLVMIDVQGAFMAPPEYDLVCLLYDLQVDLSEAFIDELFRAMLPKLPDSPDLAEARLRFDAIATVRLCKDISHLVHAARERGDHRRWHEIPRGLALLEQAAGRVQHTFPEIRVLTSVTQALITAARSGDSSVRGPVR